MSEPTDIREQDERDKPPARMDKAVAIEYVRGSDEAPRVTASGRGAVAEQILAIAFERGIKVRTSSYTRHHVNISMTRAKANGHYINSMLALQEALSGGADEAMLLDPEGYVAEGSGENIFLVKDGVIYTPELTACLNGITRNTIFHLAEDLGLKVVEKRITRDEVYIADEAFFTGTAAEVTPIREVDGRIIGCGSRGPVSTRLQQLYFDTVNGRNAKHLEWLTAVR